MRDVLRWGVAGIALAGLSACASQTPLTPDEIAVATDAELQSANGAGAPGPGMVEQPQAAPPAASRTDYGSGVFATAPRGSETATPGASSGDGRSFQFRDAPIDLVLNQVLGEGFGQSFTIDPSVQGRITLRLDSIPDAAAAVAALDAALRLQGIRISQAPGGYMVTRADAGGGGTGAFAVLADPSDVPAGEAAVLFLRYANPADVVRLAKPLLPADVVKLTEPSLGMIVLQGANRDVAAAADALRAFDVDWFAATSSAFVRLETAPPGDVKRELEQILGRTGGVEIVALPRLGAVLIFARTRELLDRAQALLVDLDGDQRQGSTDDTLFYEAKYISVERLQSVANSMFGAGGPTSGAANAEPVVAANTGSAGVTVATDPHTNLIIVQGPPSQIRRASDLFARLDRPQRQVLIEATIVEVSLRDEFRFGVQWDGVSNFLDVTFTDASSGTVASKFPGVSIVYANTDILSVVNALDSTTDVEIVSSPRVLALNNESARIQVGDQVPIVTQSAVSVTDPGAPIVNSTSYRDTGVILEVTPRIRAGDVIEIEITQEVSDVAETVTSGIDSPTISTRRLQSVLAVPNGATIALGGLISSNKAVSESGVPILKDIPFLDTFFTSKTDIIRRVELVILLRPVLLEPDDVDPGISRRLSDALERIKPSWLQ
jgi:general secretion pathway protein D